MVWIDLDGRQYHAGTPSADMDRKRPRHCMLVRFGDLDMGARVTNVSFALDLQALAYMSPPPSECIVYVGSVETFRGSVDRIQVDADSIEVTAIA